MTMISMTKRLIRSHKGGRTARAPEARMTLQERERLDTVLEQRGIKHTDWYIGHVNADYAAIIGEDTMNFDKIAKQVIKDGEKCTADDVKRLYDSLDDENKKAVTEKWMIETLRNTQPPINA